uniref:Protein kinase domain-containing protein n=1 Tax=Oryza nivara TaxID=4536 RepID=A0A0E0FFE5_ORYNI
MVLVSGFGHLRLLVGINREGHTEHHRINHDGDKSQQQQNKKALLVSSLLAIVATDAAGAGQNPQYCPPSSCGHLRNISYPFRLQGDSRQCVATPRPWYNLSYSSGKATIHINTGTYYVTSIDYTGEVFSVVDATLQDDDTNGTSCPLPRSDHLPYIDSWPPYLGERSTDSYGFVDLATASDTWACFVNCSRAITDTMPWYRPVTCLLPNNSFVFVSSSKCAVRELQPSCRYLAMIPFDDWHISDNSLQLQNASYTDIIGFIRKGFYVHFPYHPYQRVRMSATKCLKDSKRYFKERISRPSILNLTRAIFWSETNSEVDCGYEVASIKDRIFLGTIVSAIDITKFHFGSLVIFIFLAHKYWKTRITIDVVEKFLRMQQMIGPMRFAYTDIIAITSHFRDKLGQGGYGFVYKGVLLPGNVHIAVKMLTGSSSCNGDEFISEVSTIGRIHHVNVVRLVGFCSEEMRRALVYEYMPRGSLDKYIFSVEKSFSWDKLNEIALGIARGINYLHQGCEMQILHFDIKPHNILLDDNFVPKVADFGLAKLYPRDKSFVPVSAARGTVGYIAPEMISRSFGVISSKSDVYSFGMLLLEMAGGRRNADPNAANSSQAYYSSRVYRELTRRETSEISDIADMHELEKKLCIVGLWCIQMRSCDRPTMSEVIEMLEGGTDELQVPPRPFFCDDEQFPGVESYNMPSELTAISEEHEDDDDESICLFENYHASILSDKNSRRGLLWHPAAPSLASMKGNKDDVSASEIMQKLEHKTTVLLSPVVICRTYPTLSVSQVTHLSVDNTNNSCPLPGWGQHPYTSKDWLIDSDGFGELAPCSHLSACFLNCSRPLTDYRWYTPVNCLSGNHVFVFVSTDSCDFAGVPSSCGYLAMVPFDDSRDPWDFLNESYADIVGLTRKGFHVKFPFPVDFGDIPLTNVRCLSDSIRYFKEQITGASILNITRALFWSEIHFVYCRTTYHAYTTQLIWSDLSTCRLVWEVLFRFVLAPLVVFIFIAHKYWKTRITNDAVEKFLRMQQMLGPTRYTYTDIIAITSHFRDKLGQGGYGSGYKEMTRALVYEYMPRGSLDKYIFSPEKSFSWDKLNEIALGIARGINYLHQGCEMQILHFDIKPHNILLDDNFVPKVADFGLAKLYPRDESFVPVSAARGTVGYIAPEMISRSFGVISSKSDVYSFGMLILEMAGGRRNADPNAANSSQAYYPSRVYRQLTRRETCEISDIVDMHELERKLCIVGLWCIQMRSCDRPTMSEVIEMLEGGIDNLQVPPRPFFCDDEQFTEVEPYHPSSNLTAISEEEQEDDDDDESKCLFRSSHAGWLSAEKKGLGGTCRFWNLPVSMFTTFVIDGRFFGFH